jgi:septal ring factor EnvC (AmiA/AmiB activator)
VPPSALCRQGLLLLAIAIAAPVVAQAPVEERLRRGDAYTEAQQRVEFSRQNAERAALRVKDAEQGLKDAEAELVPAQRRYEESKSRLDKARADLTRARAAAGESRTSYETESAAFQRLRARSNNDRGSK